MGRDDAVHALDPAKQRINHRHPELLAYAQRERARTPTSRGAANADAAAAARAVARLQASPTSRGTTRAADDQDEEAVWQALLDRLSPQHNSNARPPRSRGTSARANGTTLAAAANPVTPLTPPPALARRGKDHAAPQTRQRVAVVPQSRLREPGLRALQSEFAREFAADPTESGSLRGRRSLWQRWPLQTCGDDGGAAGGASPTGGAAFEFAECVADCGDGAELDVAVALERRLQANREEIGALREALTASREAEARLRVQAESDAEEASRQIEELRKALAATREAEASLRARADRLEAEAEQSCQEQREREERRQGELERERQLRQQADADIGGLRNELVEACDTVAATRAEQERSELVAEREASVLRQKASSMRAQVAVLASALSEAEQAYHTLAEEASEQANLAASEAADMRRKLAAREGEVTSSSRALAVKQEECERRAEAEAAAMSAVARAQGMPAESWTEELRAAEAATELCAQRARLAEAEAQRLHDRVTALELHTAKQWRVVSEQRKRLESERSTGIAELQGKVAIALRQRQSAATRADALAKALSKCRTEGCATRRAVAEDLRTFRALLTGVLDGSEPGRGNEEFGSRSTPTMAPAMSLLPPDSIARDVPQTDAAAEAAARSRLNDELRKQDRRLLELRLECGEARDLAARRQVACDEAVAALDSVARQAAALGNAAGSAEAAQVAAEARAQRCEAAMLEVETMLERLGEVVHEVAHGEAAEADVFSPQPLEAATGPRSGDLQRSSCHGTCSTSGASGGPSRQGGVLAEQMGGQVASDAGASLVGATNERLLHALWEANVDLAEKANELAVARHRASMPAPRSGLPSDLSCANDGSEQISVRTSSPSLSGKPANDPGMWTPLARAVSLAASWAAGSSNNKHAAAASDFAA